MKSPYKARHQSGLYILQGVIKTLKTHRKKFNPSFYDRVMVI
ncbi:hypothetical protein FACS189483_10330 [Spirochaetia bacterium]|nr:hypothetical protein FACS189483_10330 [Spirochaetia bacterium]